MLQTFTALIALIAATAATVQSYVAWTGRNDLIKSTVIAQALNTCTEASGATDKYVGFIRLFSIVVITGKVPDDLTSSLKDLIKYYFVLDTALEKLIFVSQAIDEKSAVQLQAERASIKANMTPLLDYDQKGSRFPESFDQAVSDAPKRQLKIKENCALLIREATGRSTTFDVKAFFERR